MSHCNPTALIVPCYNEEFRLSVEKWYELLQNTSIRICFVNDGSKDRTEEVLQKISTKCPERVEIVTLNSNVGKSEAIRAGLIKTSTKFPSASIIGYIDADFAIPTAEIRRLVELAEISQYDVLMASRVKLLGREINRRRSRHVLGRLIVTFISSKSLKFPYDPQCGFKIFKNSNSFKDALGERFKTRWFFDLEIITRMRMLGELRMREEPLENWLEISDSRIRARTILCIAKEILYIRKQVKKLWI